MTNVWVNGEQMTLAWNVGALSYDRVLNLAGMNDDDADYEIIYADPKHPEVQTLYPGDVVFPLENMQIQVRRVEREHEPWWMKLKRVLWPN